MSVILCGTMVLGMVTGCGSSKGGDSGDKVTINLYQNKSEISSQLQEAADKYTEENPNVTINVESIQGNDYNTNLKAKLISDDSVDIYALGDNITNMTDYVEDLSDQEWLKNAVDGSLDDVTLDGKRLTVLLAKVLAQMPQNIAIEGHTGKHEFTSGGCLVYRGTGASGMRLLTECRRLIFLHRQSGISEISTVQNNKCRYYCKNR